MGHHIHPPLPASQAHAMTEKTQALLFDYGGTLDADGVPWKDHFEAVYRSLGMPIEQERFDRAFYDADDSLTEEGLDHHGLDAMLNEQVGRVFKNLGLDSRELRDRAVQAFRADTLKKIAENKPVLVELKKRYRLGVISNFYGNLPALLDELGVGPLFEVVVDSRRIGHIKPSREIFTHALNGVGASPEQTVMIGDSFKRDMLGARAMGMAHVFLRPETSTQAPCCPGDRVIHRLADLLEYF